MLGVFVLLLVSTNFLEMEMSAEEVQTAFAESTYKPKHEYIDYQNSKVHYVCIGDSLKTPLLLIHGSPGSYDAWISLLANTNLLENYFVISIDRPGYGQTTLSGGISLQEQSNSLGAIVKRHFLKKPGIIMGHSYGGALALQIANDYPQSFYRCISLAGTLSPKHQNPKWYNYAVEYSPISWLIKDDLNNSNQEMWILPNDLHLLYSNFTHPKLELILLQGGKDILVDPKTAHWALDHIENEKAKLFFHDDLNHFMIWQNHDLVMETLKWQFEY